MRSICFEFRVHVHFTIHGLASLWSEIKMGNRRLTLARPPSVLSPPSSKSSCIIQKGRPHDGDWIRFRRNSQIRFQGPAAEAIRSDVELLEMDLEDWMNAEHFPPLSSSQKNCSVAFGLPKHSQPDDPTRAERLRHHKIPPIAAVDAQTIAVGNLPIQFSWASKDLSSGDDRDCIRTTDQILQTLQSPVGIHNQDL